MEWLEVRSSVVLLFFLAKKRYNDLSDGDKMKMQIDGTNYDVIIERKKQNKNTYLRVKPDLSILITTGMRTREKDLLSFLENHYHSISKMIEKQQQKQARSEVFSYLGKVYDRVYSESFDVVLGENKVFLNRNTDLDRWYKKQAQTIFLEHLDNVYHRFTERIPYPKLKIRKMTSRWGVCNTKEKTITLNLELIHFDPKYLDYVIVHELSHLVYANHSNYFWQIVEKNLPNYKMLRKEMKEF